MCRLNDKENVSFVQCIKTYFALMRTVLESQEASPPVVPLTSHSEAVIELRWDYLICRIQ